MQYKSNWSTSSCSSLDIFFYRRLYAGEINYCVKFLKVHDHVSLHNVITTLLPWQQAIYCLDVPTEFSALTLTEIFDNPYGEFAFQACKRKQLFSSRMFLTLFLLRECSKDFESSRSVRYLPSCKLSWRFVVYYSVCQRPLVGRVVAHRCSDADLVEVYLKSLKLLSTPFKTMDLSKNPETYQETV